MFGFGGIDWLGSPGWARVTVVILVLWRWTGYLTIFFLAGLQNVPRELYEAAAIDGAGPVGRFRNVTVPCLRPVTAFVAVTVLVSTAQIFEEPFLLTQGGPGESTLSVAMFIFRAGFQRQQLGYAAAAGVLLFVAVFVLGRLAMHLLGVGRDDRRPPPSTLPSAHPAEPGPGPAASCCTRSWSPCCSSSRCPCCGPSRPPSRTAGTSSVIHPDCGPRRRHWPTTGDCWAATRSGGGC